MQNSERRRSLRRSRRRREADIAREEYENEEENEAYDDFEDEDDEYIPVSLPEHRLRFALLAGVLAGIVMIASHFLIPFLNVAAFQRAATLGDKMGYDTAAAVAGLDCLGVVIDIVVCCVLGYFVGRYAVQRRLGLYAGVLAGFVLYIGISLVSYIPGYPGNASTPAFSPSFILPLAIFAVFYGIIGGLITLVSTWITTRRNPYYALK